MTNEEFIKSISLEGEIWKDVVGYEGYYIVSNLGRIISLSRPIFNGKAYFSSSPSLLRQYISSTGYKIVTLMKNGTGRKYRVHRLVAIAFIPNPENKPFIDHINTIRTDNRMENIRWATLHENNSNPITRQKNSDSNKGRSVWNSRKIIQLKDGKLIRICESSRQFMQYGFSQGAIIQCCLGRRKHHKGFNFMYLSDYENPKSVMSKNS